MKIERVHYSRLFSFAKYSNERITFDASVGPDEDADKVLGELFFKVTEIEDVLQAYRNCLSRLDGIAGTIDHDASQIGELTRRIAEMKVSIDKLARGEPDERLRAACDRESLKSLNAQLKRYQKSLERDELEKSELSKQLEGLREKIAEGDFSPNETVESLLKTSSVEIY